MSEKLTEVAPPVRVSRAGQGRGEARSLSAVTPILQPGEQRGAAATRNRPYQADLEALAEPEPLQAEEEGARDERMSDDPEGCVQLTPL